MVVAETSAVLIAAVSSVCPSPAAPAAFTETVLLVPPAAAKLGAHADEPAATVKAVKIETAAKTLDFIWRISMNTTPELLGMSCVLSSMFLVPRFYLSSRISDIDSEEEELQTKHLLCALHRYVYKIFLRRIKVMATGEML